MIEIIPTILNKDFKEVKESIKKVENYVNWVQLDIMDGIFVNNETWNNPDDLKKIDSKVKIEAHLMIDKPIEKINDWLDMVDRIIIHFETSKDGEIKEIIKRAKDKKKEIGLAINPETHFSVVLPFLNDLDLVLIMTVQPGFGGQEFKEFNLKKIKALRKIWKNGNIEVDGGVNNRNIKRIKKAGANLICSGSYIFNNSNIEKAIKSLK
ncbi:ribulose-phosphate 3-epimerase [Patescibacteria group bacterium]|nr:ribulose-phosphate 3-epimerase [Patescibacteria group bacterium]